jgi:hypothetical protein
MILNPHHNRMILRKGDVCKGQGKHHMPEKSIKSPFSNVTGPFLPCTSSTVNVLVVLAASLIGLS